MNSPVIATETNYCWSRFDRPAACGLLLALMALFATLGIAQSTNPSAQTGTNQAPAKPDSHVETPTTYDVDLTGGRAQPKPPAKPSSNPQPPPAEKPATASLTPYELFRNQADALQFPPEQQGTDHVGIRTYARYTYILTNIEHHARSGKPLGLEEQASLAFDFFLREIKTGEFKGASPQANANSLLEISERPPATSPPPEGKMAPARLSDPLIAAVAYLALRYVEYSSLPDIERGYKPEILYHMTHSVYWHPWNEFLHTGLTRTSLPKILIDIPLAKTDPVCHEPPNPLWHPPESLPIAIKSINQGGLVLIYYDEADDSPFERRMFRTNTFNQYVQQNRVMLIKAIGGQRPDSDSPTSKLQQQYGVTAFPTMIVLGTEGRELARPSVTESGPAPLLNALEDLKKVNAATAAKAREEYLQNLRQSRPPRRSGRGFQ